MRHPSLRIAPRARVAAARGFTMVEMLAVIAMIGILTVAASPVFIDMMRDRRVSRAAQQVADYYRTARTRALGRGMPVLIRWSANAGLQRGSSGVLTILEPIVNDVPDVNTSCAAVNWSDPAQTYAYAAFDVGDGHYENAVLTFNDPSNSPQTDADICFSPRGGAYMRTKGAFAPLTGVPSFTVANVKPPNIAGLVRTVFIPPNGIARLAQ